MIKTELNRSLGSMSLLIVPFLDVHSVMLCCFWCYLLPVWELDLDLWPWCSPCIGMRHICVQTHLFFFPVLQSQNLTQLKKAWECKQVNTSYVKAVHDWKDLGHFQKSLVLTMGSCWRQQLAYRRPDPLLSRTVSEPAGSNINRRRNLLENSLIETLPAPSCNIVQVQQRAPDLFCTLLLSAQLEGTQVTPGPEPWPCTARTCSSPQQSWSVCRWSLFIQDHHSSKPHCCCCHVVTPTESLQEEGKAVIIDTDPRTSLLFSVVFRSPLRLNHMVTCREHQEWLSSNIKDFSMSFSHSSLIHPWFCFCFSGYSVTLSVSHTYAVWF